MSAQGVASTLLEGMYHSVTQLYTHEAGGWPRGRFLCWGLGWVDENLHDSHRGVGILRDLFFYTTV